MSEKSCPKSVPGLTNIPKNKPKWSIGFECSHPVIDSPIRILTICIIYKRLI